MRDPRLQTAGRHARHSHRARSPSHVGNASATVQVTDPRTPRRVRHEPRRRQLDVKQVERLAANMIRVTLGGDLAGFTSLGFDDHVKLFFPDLADVDAEAASRDYTPRRYDPAANTLDIDFVLHDAGPATRWASRRSPARRSASADRAARSLFRRRMTGTS